MYQAVNIPPRRFLATAWFLAFAWLHSACGAPTKSAGDVASLFTAPSTSLADKEAALCDSLGSRDKAPSTKKLSVNLGGCADAGGQAQSLQAIKSFTFIGLDDGASTAGNLLHQSVRAEVWLGLNLLSLAQALVAKMQANKDGDLTGLISLPDSTGGNGLAGLATPKISIVEKPTMNLETLTFGLKINLGITGAITADNDIQIDGALINNALAITAATTKAQPLEKSLINSFSAVILMIPHASDIYVDLYVDLNVNKIGLDSLVKKNVTTFLSTGLKGALDSMTTLK